MPRKRYQNAFQTLLIGFLIGYALALLRHPKPKVVSKDTLRKLNRQWVRTVLTNAAQHEENNARS